VYGWGQRFEGFLDLHVKVFFLSTMPGAVLTPAGQVFFLSKYDLIPKDLL
jgi:hypothetical protein